MGRKLRYLGVRYNIAERDLAKHPMTSDILYK